MRKSTYRVALSLVRRVATANLRTQLQIGWSESSDCASGTGVRARRYDAGG